MPAPMADATLYDLMEAAAPHAGVLFASAVAVPVVGTVAAALGKRGKTAEDGRFLASVVVVFGVGLAVVEGLLLLWFAWVQGKDPFAAPLLILLAPPVCCAGCLAGVSRVFPLRTLGGYRWIRDVLAFSALSVGVVWLLSRFHWGVVFFGGLAQLAVLFVAVALALRWLFRRVVRPGSSP